MYFAVNELKSIELSSQGKHAAEEVDNSTYNCDEGDVSVTTTQVGYGRFVVAKGILWF